MEHFIVSLECDPTANFFIEKDWQEQAPQQPLLHLAQ
jgi:hypothetical protein